MACVAIANEAVARAWIGLWNEHALDRLDDLLAPDYVHHTMSGQDLDSSGFRQGFAAVLDAFPELTYRIEHVIAAGDLVAAYVVADATHGGTYFGIPATGRKLTLRGSYHCRVVAGRIVEDWDVFDLLTPLLRLGAEIRLAAVDADA